jgi:hypothetical protein
MPAMQGFFGRATNEAGASAQLPRVGWGNGRARGRARGLGRRGKLARAERGVFGALKPSLRGARRRRAARPARAGGDVASAIEDPPNGMVMTLEIHAVVLQLVKKLAPSRSP